MCSFVYEKQYFVIWYFKLFLVFLFELLLILCSTVKKCVLHKFTEENSQAEKKSLLNCHFIIFTCFEWNFGRELWYCH